MTRIGIHLQLETGALEREYCVKHVNITHKLNTLAGYFEMAIAYIRSNSVSAYDIMQDTIAPMSGTTPCKIHIRS